MKTNLEVIEDVINYIEIHLSETLDLDRIANAVSYSKYHLSRMFMNIVGMSMHQYIQKRRLSEAARLLVCTDLPVMEIALSAGYETQQSFSVGFRSLFKTSPSAYRKQRKFYPIQLRFTVNQEKMLREEYRIDMKILECKQILLIGYCKNTRYGFSVIGKCWHKLHKHKDLIAGRTDINFLIGVNDYTAWELREEKHPVFTYFAGAEVSSIEQIPKGMESKELPESKYVMFSFRGHSEDSLQPLAEYIYKEWFPQSTYRLNEAARYDFARYGEIMDNEGNSLIEYWVPIL